ncbi:Histone-fold [Cynara cardunculus var. scolymus]|uniref:Histone-fold n=1 Tax=Cynara cardunculus var. scolymus TaxID=59895 RepID=A0A124SAT7_CYNCS|nr:Histone-fold [Cynara cardunculus var. scolymus]
MVRFGSPRLLMRHVAAVEFSTLSAHRLYITLKPKFYESTSREIELNEEMERGGSGFHGYERPPLGAALVDMNVRPPSNSSSGSTTVNDNECLVREQDRLMPIANVIRIMRKILPPHAKISDEAKETIQECVSEYISFVTSEANHRCQREQRKTVTAEDILWAMSKLGFDDYIEPLTIYLHHYREFDFRATITDHVKRPTHDPPPANSFHHAFATVFHHTGLFGTGHFFNDQPKVLVPSRLPSAATVAGFEPYARCKE